VLLIYKIEFTSRPISAAISLPSKVKKETEEEKKGTT
jgi:hypothetical protein